MNTQSTKCQTAAVWEPLESLHTSDPLRRNKTPAPEGRPNLLAGRNRPTRGLLIAAIAFASTAISARAVDAPQTGGTNPTDETKKNAGGAYAIVNGLKMYYEIHGTGAPLVLLHGGVRAGDMFTPLLPTLSAHRQVIAVDLQAHGRTTDINRPLRFELMADDIAALIKHLGIERADVLGYSLGGGVACRTAIQHPEAVRKLVVISACFKRDGFYPEVLATMNQMGPQAGAIMKQSPLAKLYPAVDWGVLFTKLGDLLRQDYDWSKEVAAIKVQTMLVFADADAIRPAHIAEFYGLLGGGKRDAGLDGSGRPTAQLAILPGFTHYNILSSPSLLTVLPPFLDAPMPKTTAPQTGKQ